MRQKFVCTILIGKYIKEAGGELERQTGSRKKRMTTSYLIQLRFDPIRTSQETSTMSLPSICQGKRRGEFFHPTSDLHCLRPSPQAITPSHPQVILALICRFSTFLVAQKVNHLSTMLETQVQSLGWEETLEKEMAIHSSTIAWKIPWTEEPGRLQSMGLQRVGHD